LLFPYCQEAVARSAAVVKVLRAETSSAPDQLQS